MAFHRFDRIFEWQEIAIALLKKYCDRFYKTEKNAFEAPHRKYVQLDKNDPKLAFYKTIKELEQKMRDDKKDHAEQIQMHSFVISSTPLHKVRWWDKGLEGIDDFAERNVLFRNEDQQYIEKVFSQVLLMPCIA